MDWKLWLHFILFFSLISYPNSLSPPASTSMCLSHLLSPQWRVSGWSGGRGRGAASPVTAARSRGSGAAVHPCTAGPSARVFTKRAESAPTRPAAVRITNLRWRGRLAPVVVWVGMQSGSQPLRGWNNGVLMTLISRMSSFTLIWFPTIRSTKRLAFVWVGWSICPSHPQRSLAVFCPCCRRG